MKIRMIVYSMLIGFLFVGCSKPVPESNTYLSSVETEYKVQAVSTDFKYISLTREEESKISEEEYFYHKYDDLEVVSAMDNNQIHYTLLAPTKFSGTGGTSKLDTIILYHSVPIKDNELKQFIQKIDESIAVWGKQYSDTDGYNATFNISSKDMRMRYSYQNNSTGPVSSIRIETGKTFTFVNGFNNNEYEYTYFYEYTTLGELKVLRYKLNEALNTNHKK